MSFGKKNIEWHFILRFYENFNSEVNIDKVTVIRLLVFFVVLAYFAMTYLFFLVKRFL